MKFRDKFLFGNKQKFLDRQLVGAAGKGDLDYINELLEQGANINGHDKHTLHPPLVVAAWAGKAEAVRRLLDRGAEPNVRNWTGHTPLMAAASNGFDEVVDLLLKAGADPELRCARHHTAAYYAGSNGFWRIEQALKKPKAAAPAPGPDEIVFRRKLGGTEVYELYNFRDLEKITLAHSKTGENHIVAREKFSEISEQPGLRQAFNEHVKRGGSADEKTVFGRKIIFPRLPRNPGA